MQVLLEELFACTTPNITPTGNPTYLEFKEDYLDRMFGNDFVQRDISTLDEKMSFTDLASILSENNTSFRFNSETNTTYYSLNSEEINGYLNQPNINQVQKDILDKVFENNKRTDFEESTHQYFTDVNGVKLELIPVSNLIYKGQFNNQYEGFLELGNSIHEMVKNINLNTLPRYELLNKIDKSILSDKGYPVETTKQIFENINGKRNSRITIS